MRRFDQSTQEVVEPVSPVADFQSKGIRPFEVLGAGQLMGNVLSLFLESSEP